ncbi:hypothetical protein BHE74_00013547 [Ensete ventricosum]|nr:hypothetical protein BHE74_00013547 [Ensete ventricosum]
MKVDFPRGEEGDLNRWISRAERYFRFYRIADATWVEIAAIHLEGDAIQSAIEPLSRLLFLLRHVGYKRGKGRPPLPAGDRHSLRAIAPMSEWHRLAWPPGPRVAPPHVATWPVDDRHAGVLAGTAYASDLGCRRPLQAA